MSFCLKFNFQEGKTTLMWIAYHGDCSFLENNFKKFPFDLELKTKANIYACITF